VQPREEACLHFCPAPFLLSSLVSLAHLFVVATAWLAADSTSGGALTQHGDGSRLEEGDVAREHAAGDDTEGDGPTRRRAAQSGRGIPCWRTWASPMRP